MVRGQVIGKAQRGFQESRTRSPIYEEGGTALANMIGADRVLGGSDWPHGERTEQPLGIAKTFDGLTASERKLILRGNGNLLLGRS